MIFVYLFIFFISCVLLIVVGNGLISSVIKIAEFLEWNEFVVAFFVMAIISSIPNFFVGISSVVHEIPQLSFGDVVGGNVIDLTLAAAIAVLISKKGLPAESRIVQTTSFFTVAIAILPLLLIVGDKTLGRGDGIILISSFVFYIYWLFSKKKRFRKFYQEGNESLVKGFKIIIRDIGKIILGIAILPIAAEGIVESAKFFSIGLGISISLVGILIVGLGNAIPEIYFAGISAKNDQNWIVLGDLMSAIVTPSSLVLGIVALINPIKISNFPVFISAVFFLILAAIFFTLFIRTGRKLTKKEAFFLLGIYIAFVITELLIG